MAGTRFPPVPVKENCKHSLVSYKQISNAQHFQFLYVIQLPQTVFLGMQEGKRVTQQAIFPTWIELFCPLEPGEGDVFTGPQRELMTLHNEHTVCRKYAMIYKQRPSWIYQMKFPADSHQTLGRIKLSKERSKPAEQ